jgi:tryptophanyl-tRNA synthetase
MAADILLYQTDVVPIGQDQKQHLEIARDIAIRFNKLYGDTFVVPEAYIAKQGAKIMSLQEPDKKMSKSDTNVNNFVLLIEERDAIIKKFKRAVTDSDAVVKFAEGKDGINNLMSIYSAFTGKDFDEIEREFDGKGYGDFKSAVGEVCADGLESVRTEYAKLVNDKAYLESIMKDGAEKASYLASKTLSKVYRKVGFYSVK